MADFTVRAGVVLQVQAPPATIHEGTTVPDPHSLSLHLGFTTEGASVLGVLADFNFLHNFPEGGTITVPYLLTILTFSVHLATLPQTNSEPREQDSFIVSVSIERVRR